MHTNVAPFGYPEFSFDEATKEGKYIQFFEQAFEWDQMICDKSPQELVRL